MEYLPNGYTLELPEGAFPLSTDSMVLSHFVHLPKNAAVLDLGSGCGTLGVLLCSGNNSCNVCGIELTETAHLAALDNIRRNNLGNRMKSIHADLRTVKSTFPMGSFSVCVSNPPYFRGGPASESLPLARKEESCTLEDLVCAADWALKYGGDFFMVHRPERLGEIIAVCGMHKLEAKRLCLMRHREKGPVSLILLQLRKGGKPGLSWEELTLFNADGTPTAQYQQIYHR